MKTKNMKPVAYAHTVPQRREPEEESSTLTRATQLRYTKPRQRTRIVVADRKLAATIRAVLEANTSLALDSGADRGVLERALVRALA